MWPPGSRVLGPMSAFQMTSMILTSCQTDTAQLRYWRLLGKPSVLAIFHQVLRGEGVHYSNIRCQTHEHK